MISRVTGRPTAAQHLCDLARLRRVRDGARDCAFRSRGHPDPYPGAALSRPAIAPEVMRLGLVPRTEVLRNG
jgi:hypothetical protein